MKTGVLDIGGTFIKSALYDEEIGLRNKKETPTPARLGGKAIMECAVKLLEEMGTLDAIGVSTAGRINSEAGIVIGANDNIREYAGTPIREILETRFQVPVAVDNDVNMAALGEACLGAGSEKEEFLCLTYGTGVGGAIIQNRTIYHGSCFSAAEFGAIVTHGEILRKSGFPEGTYEKYASVTALVQRALEYDLELSNGKRIFSRLEDPIVKEIVEDWIGEILLGLSSLIHIFNPSCVILGGGVMEQPYVLERIRSRIGDYVMPGFQKVEIKSAKLGNCAGMLGAAIAAKGGV